jgi:HEPN domain-containing protein
MASEPPRRGSPGDWLRHARSDLALARTTPTPEIMLEALCFHAQQAAEKAIKAVLVVRGITPPSDP